MQRGISKVCILSFILPSISLSILFIKNAIFVCLIISGCQSCEVNKEKVASLIAEMKEKDTKWNILINSLHEKLVKSSKDKLDLENEIYRFRMRNVKSKVGQELKLKKDQNQPITIINHEQEEKLRR